MKGTLFSFWGLLYRHPLGYSDTPLDDMTSLMLDFDLVAKHLDFCQQFCPHSYGVCWPEELEELLKLFFI